MSLRAGVGISAHTDAYVAGLNAAQTAVERMGGEPKLLLVFASTAYDQEKMLGGIRTVSHSALIVGSSTAGEITTEGPAPRHSVAVMALASDELKCYASVGEHIDAGATAAGSALASAIKQQAGTETLQFLMMFPDILAGNGGDVVRGILKELGDTFPVVGGASGDDFAFQKTYQYLNDKIYSGSVVGVGVDGGLSFGIGVRHGWIPVSAPRRVTKSEGSTIFEIEGKPAIDIYADYFGKEEADKMKNETLAKLATFYPLGVKAEYGSEMLIRDPLKVNPDGTIVCAAEIPDGSDVHLMIGSHDEAIAAAKAAAQQAFDSLGGKTPKAAIIFDCIARRKMLGDRAGDEIAAIQNVIGKETPLIGFYTYGEQAPVFDDAGTRHKSTFFNETSVVCLLAD